MRGLGNRVGGVKAMGWLSLWWRQPDHYNELSSHLQARGIAGIARAAIAVIAGGLAVGGLATISTPTGPRGAVPLAATLIACIAGLGGASQWALRFPTRALAIRCAMLATIAVALVVLAQRDAVVAMALCTAFAIPATYIALFHSAPLMLLNVAVASVVGGIEGVRVAAKFNVVAGLGGYLLLLLLILAVPFGIQVVVHVLSTDAMQAERDELTGLLTRRAFRRRAKDRLEQGRDELGYFVIAMIDLDRFKQLNDNYGHGTGDDALVSVARALRDTADDTAVIGRSGGEEFVIADIWHPDEVKGRAQRLCDVIAGLSFGVTASIGTAGIHPTHGARDGGDLLADLIAAADDAMYVAKRGGGNQTHHSDWPLPPTASDFSDDDTDYPSDGISA
jgi:diguanylate cyclase (GGDEF)-like protein